MGKETLVRIKYNEMPLHISKLFFFVSHRKEKRHQRSFRNLQTLNPNDCYPDVTVFWPTHNELEV